VGGQVREATIVPGEDDPTPSLSQRSVSQVERLLFWLPAVFAAAAFMLTATGLWGSMLGGECAGVLRMTLRAVLILLLALSAAGLAAALGFAVVFGVSQLADRGQDRR
jgi:cytosine/uracil/thiamine/allantoin permease